MSPSGDERGAYRGTKGGLGQEGSLSGLATCGKEKETGGFGGVGGMSYLCS